ncbi:MAG: hypothetical protein ACOCXS_00370 [Bacteroidota bacterium]
MRTILKTLFIFLPFIILLLAPFSCEDCFVESYEANVSVYRDYDEFGNTMAPSSDKDSISSNQIAWFNDIHAFDVISVNGNLFLFGEDGFHQYSYQNPPQVSYLSSIPVESAEEYVSIKRIQ